LLKHYTRSIKLRTVRISRLGCVCCWHTLEGMPLSFMCHECEQRAVEATTLMRRHASKVQASVRAAGRLHMVEQQHLRDEISASLLQAQSAWDSYPEHLLKHGVAIPVRSMEWLPESDYGHQSSMLLSFVLGTKMASQNSHLTPFPLMR
jgi:hypothetical protein